MSKKYSNKCVLCGIRSATTVEHIPPKTIFSKPYPNNLLTVPSCLKCNNSSSKDDEYFALIALAERAGDSASACKTRNKVLKSTRRPESKKYREYIISNVQSVNIHHYKTEEFIFQKDTLLLDKTRIFNTITKCIKGLYFIETNQILPPDTEIYIYNDDEIHFMPEENLTIFKEGTVRKLLAIPPKWKGDFFNYRCIIASDSRITSTWALGFFRRLGFFVFLVSKKDKYTSQ